MRSRVGDSKHDCAVKTEGGGARVKDENFIGVILFG
jgi:hypothetical protein